MKDKCNILRLGTLVLSAFLLAPVAHAAVPTPVVVYSNTNTDLGIRFNPGTLEVGDEITLGGTERVLSSFAFEYWGLSFTSGEQARVRFYANDGAAGPAGSFLPFSPLFDSGWFGVVGTDRSTLTFSDSDINPANDLSAGNLVNLTGPVPDNFTWSVQFQGLGAGETAGVDLYDPPGPGSSYWDYWENTVSGWELRTNIVTPINFAARIEATPEPASLWLGLLGALAILGVKLRNSRR